MTVNEVMEKMIVISHGSFRDINHFLKVWAYARNIGMGEKLDEDTQKTLEMSAIVHDISCPSLREKCSRQNRLYDSTSPYLHRCGRY